MKETRRKHAKELYDKGEKNHPYVQEFLSEFEPPAKTVHSGSFKKGHKRGSHELKEEFKAEVAENE